MTDRIGELSALATGPAFMIAATLLVYAAAKKLYARVPFPLFHPVLTSVALIVALLSLVRVPYDEYRDATSLISFALEISVVALALPLHRQFAVLRRNAPEVAAGIVFASVVGVVSAVVPFLWLPVDPATAVSAAPTSVTTPIAMAVSQRAGGIPSLTAALVVLTGIIGAVIGPTVLRVIGVTNRVAWGLALGAAAHGIGTARALERGDVEGSASSLGLCLNGLLTAAIAPLLLRLVLG